MRRNASLRDDVDGANPPLLPPGAAPSDRALLRSKCSRGAMLARRLLSERRSADTLPYLSRLQSAKRGLRHGTLDHGWLCGRRERSWYAAFESGHWRGRGREESGGIAPKAAPTKSMRKATAGKAGSRCDDADHRQQRCKETLHGRIPRSVPLPHARNLIIRAIGGRVGWGPIAWSTSAGDSRSMF